MRSQCSAHASLQLPENTCNYSFRLNFRISALQQGRKRKIFPLASHRCMNVLVEYSSLLARSRGCCWGQDHGARIPKQSVGIFRIRVPALAPKIPYFLFGYALFFQITALSPLLINVLFFMLLIILLQNVPLQNCTALQQNNSLPSFRW